jgi:hypothetical protein
MLAALADDVYGPAGHQLAHSAHYRSNIDVDPAFLNDGLNGTRKIWIGYEVLIGLAAEEAARAKC